MKIFQYIILIIGIFEIISNIYHLSKGSIKKIGLSAKRQHQELPLEINNFHFFLKTIIMFIFGIIFVFTGVFLILNIHFSIIFGVISLGLLGFYGLLQALIYRKPVKIWLSFIVYNIPIIIYLIILCYSS